MIQNIFEWKKEQTSVVFVAV
uniref:Uncharacterized protein n=1 Tax=Rhizophora mucronata TaxID=61149 RepID=A0A2P2IV01_RHIMU